MALPTTTSLAAVPRRVFLFGLLLSLSLAAMGLFGSHLVTRLNASYQEIVTRQLPAIAVMRAVSQANSYARRMLDGLPADASSEDIAEVEGRILEMREANTLRLAKLQNLLKTQDGQAVISQLLETRLKYRREVTEFLKELKVGMTQEQRDRWTLRLSDVDAEYVAMQDNLADYCTKSALSVNDLLSTHSKRLVLYFFLVAAWPLILAAGFFFCGLISTFVLFYRRNR